MRVVSLSLALLLLAVGIAIAAPRTGSTDDPKDVPPASQGPPRADAKRVAVSYEPADGSLNVTLELHEPMGLVAQPTASVWVDLSFGIGTFAADGACAPPTRSLEGRAGDLRFHGQIDSSGPSGAERNVFHTTVTVVGSDRTITGTAGAISADRTVISWVVAGDPDLAGRDHRCVGDVEMPYTYHDSDLVAAFPLAVPPEPLQPATPPPGVVANVPPAATDRSVPDRLAPRVRVAVGSRSLRRLRRSGMTVPVRCHERCAVRARLLLAPATARKLRVSRLVGTGAIRSLVAGRRGAVRLHLTRGAKRALAGRRALRARLELTATDRSGNRRTVRRGLILSR